MTSALNEQEMRRPSPTERIERVLAVGRALLTVTALVAIYIDPAEPAQLRQITYGVLMAYAAYSLAIWAVVHRATRLDDWHTYALHGLDVLWTSALTFVSQGPISPFFLFFLFVLLAAAHRWGFLETFATALVTIAVFLAETALAAGAWKEVFLESIVFDTKGAILHVAYLLMTGVLLGYLAEQDKTAKAELAAMAAAAQQSNVRLGLGGSVTRFAQTLHSVMNASSVLVVVKDEDTRRALLWRLTESTTTPGSHKAQRIELDSDAERQWLFQAPGDVWLAEFPGQDNEATLLVAEPGAWRLGRHTQALPPMIVSEQHWTTVTAVDMGLEREWRARVYLLGGRERQVERRVHFLRALADHATPALTNALLIRRLRARAGAAERARVARELHDGAIQSLFAIDMKLEAIRRDAAAAGAMTHQIEEVQGLVRHEVTELRKLMQALRPVEIDAGDQLPDVLANVIERFRRETGIGVRFVSSGSLVHISPTKAVELVKIAQEALVNVRKHSGAGQVLVRLAANDTHCQLVIEDDGRGFDFEGRLTFPELDERRRGPVVIKERVRLLGAELAVESTPGAGARIEVTLTGNMYA